MGKDKSQELAKDRTDWAEDRTVLANERTFAGWMRTGLGSLGMAVALQAVFGATEPTWIAKLAALIFVFIAIVIFYIAWKSSSSMIARLEAHASEPVSKSGIGRTAAIFAFGAIVIGVVLVIL